MARCTVPDDHQVWLVRQERRCEETEALELLIGHVVRDNEPVARRLVLIGFSNRTRGKCSARDNHSLAKLTWSYLVAEYRAFNQPKLKLIYAIKTRVPIGSRRLERAPRVSRAVLENEVDLRYVPKRTSHDSDTTYCLLFFQLLRNEAPLSISFH
jgi:hypothetical protein